MVAVSLNASHSFVFYICYVWLDAWAMALENTINIWSLPVSYVNPFTLRAAKRGLTILGIFPLQKHFFENIWMRNVDQKTNKQISFKYFVKFRFILKLFSKVWKWQTIFREELLSVNGLSKETFTLAWRSSEGQKLMSAGLLLQTFYPDSSFIRLFSLKKDPNLSKNLRGIFLT